VFEEEEL
jgi:hypothetical protein